MVFNMYLLSTITRLVLKQRLWYGHAFILKKKHTQLISETPIIYTLALKSSSCSILLYLASDSPWGHR